VEFTEVSGNTTINCGLSTKRNYAFEIYLIFANGNSSIFTQGSLTAQTEKISFGIPTSGSNDKLASYKINLLLNTSDNN
jgi:hypothetical protein